MDGLRPFRIRHKSMFHQVSTFNILQLHCNAKSNFYTRLKLLRHFRIGFSTNLACSQLFQHRRKSRCKSRSVDTVCYNSISIMLPCSIDSSSVTKPYTWKSTEYARMKLLEIWETNTTCTNLHNCPTNRIRQIVAAQNQRYSKVLSPSLALPPAMPRGRLDRI